MFITILVWVLIVLVILGGIGVSAWVIDGLGFWSIFVIDDIWEIVGAIISALLEAGNG